MKYGIWDTVSSAWIGNDDGPLDYDSEEIATVAARVADPVLGFEPGRCRAKPIPPSPAWRKRDEIRTRMAPLAALEGLEDGRIL